ncbi:MAG: hypothetical protein ACOC16_02625 [Nanoarchaeota archaeon]
MAKNIKINIKDINEFKIKYLNDWRNIIKYEVNHQLLYAFFVKKSSVDDFINKTNKQRYRILESYCLKYENMCQLFNYKYWEGYLKTTFSDFWKQYIIKYLQLLCEYQINYTTAKSLILNEYKQNFKKNNSQTSSEEFYEYLGKLNDLLNVIYVEIEKYVYLKN